MATGDIKGNLHRLQAELKRVRYPKDLDYTSLGRGDAKEFLPILHYVMCDYSRPLAAIILSRQIDLAAKSDHKFLEAVYKILRDVFAYIPKLTGPRFFSRGFTEHKILLTVDVVAMVRAKHKELVKGQQRSAQGSSASNKRTLPEPDVVPVAQMMSEVLPSSPYEFLPSLNSTVEASAASPTLTPSPTPTSHPTQQTTPAVKIVVVGETPAPTPPSGFSHDTGYSAKESTSPAPPGFSHDTGYNTRESTPRPDAVIYDSELRTHPVIRELAIIMGDLVNRVRTLEEQVDTLTIMGKKNDHRTKATTILLENRIKFLEAQLSSQGSLSRQPVLQQGILVGRHSPRSSSPSTDEDDIAGHCLDTVEEEESALFREESASSSYGAHGGMNEAGTEDENEEEDREVVVIDDGDDDDDEEEALAGENGDIQAQVERIQNMMTNAQKALNMQSSPTSEVLHV